MDGKTAEVTGTGYNPKGDFYIAGEKADLQKSAGLSTVLWGGALCNNDAVLEPVNDESKQSFRMIGDPTEGAMIVAAMKAWDKMADLPKAYPRVKRSPLIPH